MSEFHDPLDVLRGGDLPVAPDPAFAARLRSRLEAAADLFERQPERTRGVSMSGTDTVLAELAAPSPPRAAAIPYLAVADARRALSWYADAFGAAAVGDPFVMDDGRVGHAELAIAGGVFYLADEYPELGLKAPARQHVSVSLMLTVPDVDAALRRARDLGADVQREPYDAHEARNATIVDPFGHRWMLTGPVAGAVAPIRHGDAAYVALWTPDAQRAAAFYGYVLGWQYEPATGRVRKPGLRIGLSSTPGDSTLFCCYAVDDLAAARAAITDGGGTIGDVEQFDFGTVLTAADSQGRRFGVVVAAPGEPRPALNGSGPGDLSYITYETPESAGLRSFYGRVLSWTFDAGRISDGWAVRDSHPMAGAAGGCDAPVTVPMWTVTDIDAAVARVGEAGGSIIDAPSQQAYGKSALCTDDQGTRFYLGEV
ncbi:VOC family protein [Mycolicibacterium psychrotolerans]|uniref:Glyoxalase n=1 Tax=Mycolicibacterium psychrotolerans TaxID=216929 RepID=A0A7I7MIC4_9MYCO|nr:VOC family protein [Mycolicibacterium psychrotolerans]BBX71928.1 glyoxalase [Mycolicibacterium psychrotolerans]